MAEIQTEVGRRLALARERAGFSQEEVAILLGQPRTVVSNWENGTRQPNSVHLSRLAAIYRIALDDLLGAGPPVRPAFQKLFFRDAGDRLDARGKYEVQRFLAFLDDYADLLEALGRPPGLSKSPLAMRGDFTSKEDVRRKAVEARSFFGLGTGPVGDLIGLADLHGIAVYFAPLGKDLKGTVSGAFMPHDRVGFAILVNAETTPGRQQFTVAHELAHALFHGDHPYVGYFGRREATERFADAFAAEFLVPTASLRAMIETLGLSKVSNPELVIHLQRLFNVSYAMILRRLQSAGLISPQDLDRFMTVQPVHLATDLGYPTEPDEWYQDPEQWGLARFPRRLLRLLRRALDDQRMTISGAASLTGVSIDEVEEFLADRPTREEDEKEFEYFGQPA